MAAIGRLGPPRVLAAEVAGTRMVPSWARGALWLAAAMAVGVFAIVMSNSAFQAAIESGVAPGVTVTWSTFLMSMTGTSVEGGPPVVTAELPLASLLLLLVPFGWGARIWRLWTGKRTPALHP